jgi:hypothetical protein
MACLVFAGLQKWIVAPNLFVARELEYIGIVFSPSALNIWGANPNVSSRNVRQELVNTFLTVCHREISGERGRRLF